MDLGYALEPTFRFKENTRYLEQSSKLYWFNFHIYNRRNFCFLKIRFMSGTITSFLKLLVNCSTSFGTNVLSSSALNSARLNGFNIFWNKMYFIYMQWKECFLTQSSCKDQSRTTEMEESYEARYRLRMNKARFESVPLMYMHYIQQLPRNQWWIQKWGEIPPGRLKNHPPVEFVEFASYILQLISTSHETKKKMFPSCVRLLLTYQGLISKASYLH